MSGDDDEKRDGISVYDGKLGFRSKEASHSSF